MISAREAGLFLYGLAAGSGLSYSRSSHYILFYVLMNHNITAHLTGTVLIEMPPLRQRKEDIPLLVEYFVKRFAEKLAKRISKIDTRTLQLCEAYPWPGNIRELQNIVERSVILCSGGTFSIDEAWLSIRDPAQPDSPAKMTRILQDQEKEIIESALAKSCRGKVAGAGGAASKLGIPPLTLDSKKILERPTLRVALLLILAVWSSCRFYYFAFYVIERYVDPDYRFSGLLSLGRFLIWKQRRKA